MLPFSDPRFFILKGIFFMRFPAFFPFKLWRCFALFFKVYRLLRVVCGLFWIVAELTGIVTALFRHCCGVDRGLTMD
jgi:hypothetical protein